MIKGILKRLTAPGPQPADPLDAIIARRAVRLNNRKPDAARAYERVHHVLASGPKK